MIDHADKEWIRQRRPRDVLTRAIRRALLRARSHRDAMLRTISDVLVVAVMLLIAALVYDNVRMRDELAVVRDTPVYIPDRDAWECKPVPNPKKKLWLCAEPQNRVSD